MSSIKKELARYGLTPRKRWGQHFLADPNILRKILQAAQVGREDIVLEIGPGLGDMTLALAKRAREVIAVEIDARLAEVLRKKAIDHPNVRIIEGDVLGIDFSGLLRQGDRRFKVVANLPYQLSTPLIFRFIDSRKIISSLTLMVQREVAERMVASPGSKTYGPLSIFTQTVAVISIRFMVKPAAFFPRPKVESALIQMDWREQPLVAPEEEGWLKEVVRGCLGYRRKTLINALKHSGLVLPENLEARIRDLGIDPRCRPETIKIQDFAKLASALRQSS